MQGPPLTSAAAPSLSAILASLPPTHAEVVRRHLIAPAWQVRAERLAERDDAIRAARDLLLAEMQPTRAANALARELTQYAATARWDRERLLVELPPGSDAGRVALHRILRLSGGKPLGWRRIHDVLRGG